MPGRANFCSKPPWHAVTNASASNFSADESPSQNPHILSLYLPRSCRASAGRLTCRLVTSFKFTSTAATSSAWRTADLSLSAVWVLDSGAPGNTAESECICPGRGGCELLEDGSSFEFTPARAPSVSFSVCVESASRCTTPSASMLFTQGFSIFGLLDKGDEDDRSSNGFGSGTNILKISCTMLSSRPCCQ